MVLAALGNSARTSPALNHSAASAFRLRAAAPSDWRPCSLSKPQALTVRLQVTAPTSAVLPSNAAHGVSASTPTPYGSLTILMTPLTTLALVSSIRSGVA